MWFDWTEAEALTFERSTGGNLERFEGQHNGYMRLEPPVIHRRGVVRAGDDVWVVVDDLFGEGSHAIEGHWLLHPGEHVLDESGKRLRLSLPGGELQLYWNAWELDDTGEDLSCGDESKAPRGWHSRYYGVREPALSLTVGGQGRLPCRIVWVFVLGEQAHQQVSFDREKVEVSIGSLQTLSVALTGLRSSERLSVKEASFTQEGRVEALRVQ